MMSGRFGREPQVRGTHRRTIPLPAEGCFYAMHKNGEGSPNGVFLIEFLAFLGYNIINRSSMTGTPKTIDNKIKEAYESHAPANITLQQFSKMVEQDPSMLDSSGQFSTFDPELAKAAKSGQHHKVVDIFKQATTNLSKTARQMSDYWLNLLKLNKSFVNTARNATPEKAIVAYEVLFNLLSIAFCEDNNCNIEVHVITSWDDINVNHENDDYRDGTHISAFALNVPENISDTQRQQIIAEVRENPDGHPYAKKISFVYVNINNIRKNFPDDSDFFYEMISVFVHEMQHALDYQHPNRGALGAQVEYIERKLGIEYLESPAEKSAYSVENLVIERLKKSKE